jgi:hypothetical protein
MDTIKSGVQQVVGEIYKRDGEVKPSVLVDEARPVESPAHKAFEWNDEKAGQEYRLMQARQWIRRVRITVEDRQERLIHVPRILTDERSEYAYSEDEDYTEPTLQIDDSQEGYYKPISVVVREVDEYEAAMAAAITKLNAAKAACEELKRAARTSKEKVPNFKRTDRCFKMVESALMV